MPRSFLLKKYYPRNDDSQIYSMLDILELGFCMTHSLKEISVADMQLFESADKLKWNYEYEKSYWFDTSGIQNLKSKERLHQQQRIEDYTQTATKDDAKRSQTSIDSIKSFIATMIQPGGISPQIEPSSPSFQTTVCLPEIPVVMEATTEEKGTGVMLNEQLEMQFSKMVAEDEGIIAYKIHEFLENNRMLLDDVANEMGIDSERLTRFMDLRTGITASEKQEICKWYLVKLFRPASSKTLTEESYTCNKCGKIFTYKSYLERHIKYVCPDSTGRSWKCNYCGKAFQYPCYLRRHVRSHTGESPYKCDKCDRAFVRSTDLQRHIRNHTGEKPYSCSQCSRAFARSTDLKRHMRTHTGEKPYKCWKCGKSFSQSGSLQTHVHTHAKEQLVKKKP